MDIHEYSCVAQLYCLKIKKESTRRRKEGGGGLYKIPKSVWTKNMASKNMAAD